MPHLSYDPGVLPSKPGPEPGEAVTIDVSGLPPHKDTHRSIRNAQHPNHDRFLALRQTATDVMDGRAWSSGPIGIDFALFAPSLPKNLSLLDFASGIEDTLDGSSGYTFTFLPIVFEDDCQICRLQCSYVKSESTHYRVVVRFMA
jgi:hypothetical protein